MIYGYVIISIIGATLITKNQHSSMTPLIKQTVHNDMELAI